jgi:glucokinase
LKNRDTSHFSKWAYFHEEVSIKKWDVSLFFERRRRKLMGDRGLWAIGVDLGGTKVEVAQVDATGRVSKRLRRPTRVEGGPGAVMEEIVAAVQNIKDKEASPPAGVGVGLAGQVDPEHGMVRFAPNLGWHDVPFQTNLADALGLPVAVLNDVRAATWGEWLHGAGQECDDLICIFVGTGIGGGVVSGGQMLSGCSNTGGEVGHMIIDLDGPPCTCGNQGCFEALAGGWAIARDAREAVSADRSLGASLLKIAGGQQEAITAETVSTAAKAGDLLAKRLIDKVGQALIAGCVSVVNFFNPCRLILGGGVIEGFGEFVERIDRGVRQHALSAATQSLTILPAQLKNDSGVVGAAAFAMHFLASKKEFHRV